MTEEHLKQLLHYDKDTGIFTWAVSRNNQLKIGDCAGSVDTRGYIQININGKMHLAHRLAFLYMTGAFPENDVDHVNRIRTDNRWMNLRSVTRLENCKNRSKNSNNSSGITGVCWYNQKWIARITVKGKTIFLGSFNDIIDAIEARKLAETKYGFQSN